MAEASERPSRHKPDPHGLAYVCFTSGTTGTPKGVLVEQRAVVRLVVGSDFIRIREGGRVALASNAVFDAITLEIWGALLNGATLVVLANDTLLDPEALATELVAERVDVLWLTAALFDQLAGQRPDMFRCLDYLLVGGGALNPAMIRAVLKCPAGSPRHLVNGYGPTENTTFSTCHLIGSVADGTRSIPIGRPIANSTAYVLDPTGMPVPPGVAGELHVGGDGLARGYLNDPGLTTQRFALRELRHPGVTERVEARLYATGDLVRWQDDGTLDFLGRIDRQLKLHGFRVEPGEIEAAITAHPAVIQAAVRPIDTDGHVRLGGWYACRPDTELAVPDLRRHLEGCLPAYMVPAFLVHMPHLPTKASGKIDFGALPPPVAAETQQSTGDAGVAKRLLAIWRHVLRNDAVGLADDFFAVGGDSILSIQVVARAREQGLQLAPRDIFQARTVERLAARTTLDIPGGSGPAPTPSGPPPLTPIQHWFFGLGLPAPHHFNQAFLLVPPHAVTPERLAHALGCLIARHDALRMRYRRNAGEHWKQAPADAVTPTVRSWCLAAADEAALQEQLTAWQASFDLEQGRLLAAGLVQGHPDGRQRILLAVHHLAVDIVSWRILLDELVRLVDDPTGTLPPAGASFGSWAHAVSAFAHAPETVASLGHWRAALWPAAMLPIGPSDRWTGTVIGRLDRESTTGLLQQSAHAYGTRVHELILAALVPAIAAACGGDRSVALLLEGHGREEAVGLDVSATVGWFTSRFPVRFELPDEPADDPGRVIVAIKEQLRGVPHNGLSYGVLRELAGKLAGAEPEITFNYLGQLDGLAAAGWEMAPEPPGLMVAPQNPATSRLDVTAFVAGGVFEVRLTAGDPGLPAGWADGLATGFLDRLRRVADHCGRQTSRRVTPADFPAAGLPAEELASLVEGDRGLPVGIYRLTPLQEGLLFHALHSPASDQYVVQFDWRCAAPIEPEALRLAWQELVMAHDVLRTRFAWRGLSHPVQVVHAAGLLSWRLADLTELPDKAAEAAAIEAERLAERTTGFDLERTGAMRVALLRLASDSWVMLWTHHHILLDGWCVPLLLDELGRRYEAIRQGQPATPVPAPPSYGSYVAWLRRQDAEQARTFWRERLRGFSLPTDIPIRRPGGVSRGHQPVTALGSHKGQLDQRTTRRLEQLARSEGVTLNAAVQLAWGCLLAAYAGGSREVLFSTIVSGRANTFPGIDRVIGLVANIVPVRVSLEPGITVAAALRDMHAWVEAGSDHSHLSLAEIQAVSDMPPETALFDSVTVFENYPSAGASVGPLGAGAATVHDKTNFPLLLMVMPGEALTFTLQYDADQFEASAIATLMGHLVHLATTLAADASQPVDRLELVAPSEREWLLAQCNATDHSIDPAATANALLDAQVGRTPDAVAVEDDAGRTLTYAALDAAANRLAHRLRAQHAADLARPLVPDTRIGLCLERGLGLITAILAVLKASGAYVALDPDHPDERLAFMAQDSDCALIVSTSELSGKVCTIPGARLVLLDDTTAEQGPAERTVPAPGPGDLAYVLYTSGSTGRPKGAMIEHRSLVNRILWMQATYPLGPDDRVLQKTPFSFDVSVWEFFWPLMVGVRLVFARPGGHKDPAYLARLIKDRCITTLHFVPSMLRVFLEVVDVARLGSLRRIFCSGEALSSELPRQVLNALPAAELHNLYGPTEATVDVSEHACSTNEPGNIVPIGRPVWNTQLHVLDTRMRLLPPGLPGELWIGGVQVGRGYLNRPELTADRFVPNPFGPGRLYRTGDLVRRRPDGILDYLGRTDFQVKVRGVRIELGEIEAALESVPGIRQALVLARPHRGETELVAYLAAAADAPDQAAIRAALSRILPEAMVPARLVRLERLPLNSSGKVDRAALPAVDGDVALPSDPAIGPAGTIEAALVDIFAEILGRPIEPADDFFAHGGHSLHAVRVVARIIQRLGAEVPLAALFEHRTASALAPMVAAAVTPASSPVPTADRSHKLPASFAQERLWFLDRVITDRATYNVPLALRIEGRLDIGALSLALDGLAADHEILRTRLVADDGQLRQEIEPSFSLPLSLETVPPARLGERLASLARQPFDLEAGPMIRAHLLRLGPLHHVLLLNQHHAITDGWSLALLLRELGTRYRSALNGDDTSPAMVPVAQYADIAAWERQQLVAGREDAQVTFWRQQLRDAATLDLPADLPRPPAMTQRGATVSFALPAGLTNQLHRIAAERGATLFTVLLTAFDILLARWTGTSDLLVATPVANRSHPAQMDALGLFVNTVALRARLDRPDAPFIELLATVGRAAADAFVHQALPFDRVLDALAVPRDPSRPPLTPVMFILQNAGDLDSFAGPGLSVERLPVGTATAKFELTLSIEQHGGVLEGTFEYALDLFQAATIERLAQAYTRLLHALADDPTLPIARLKAATDLSPGLGSHSQEIIVAPADRPPSRPMGRSVNMRALVASIWCEVLGRPSVGHDENSSTWAAPRSASCACRRGWKAHSAVMCRCWSSSAIRQLPGWRLGSKARVRRSRCQSCSRAGRDGAIWPDHEGGRHRDRRRGRPVPRCRRRLLVLAQSGRRHRVHRPHRGRCVGRTISGRSAPCPRQGHRGRRRLLRRRVLWLQPPCRGAARPAATPFSGMRLACARRRRQLARDRRRADRGICRNLDDQQLLPQPSAGQCRRHGRRRSLPDDAVQPAKRRGQPPLLPVGSHRPESRAAHRLLDRAGRGLGRLYPSARRPVRLGRRWRRYSLAAAADRLLAHPRWDPVARRPLPRLQRRCARHRAGQRRGCRRAAPTGRRHRGGRPYLRGHPWLCGQQRRCRQDRLHRAGHRWPDPGDRRCASHGGISSRHDLLCRDPRHRYATWRRDRAQGPLACPARGCRSRTAMRPWRSEGEHRSPRCRSRYCQLGQARPDARPAHAVAKPSRRATYPLPPRYAVRGRRPAAALAVPERPPSCRSELVRDGRHQCASRP